MSEKLEPTPGPGPDDRYNNVAVIDIETVPDMAGVERQWLREPKADGAGVPSKSALAAYGRPELDKMAPEIGLDPAQYSKVGDLVAAILEHLEGGGDFPRVLVRKAKYAHEAKVRDFREGILTNAALDPFTARVVAVGIMPVQGNPWELKEALGDERELLDHVAGSLCTADRLVMFADGNHFDARVLQTRLLIHGLEVPRVIREIKRYDRNRCVDLRGVLGHFDRYQRGNLADWCWRFGIEEPTETNLEELGKWWRDGQYDTLVAHVWNHTRAVAALYDRARRVLDYLPVGKAPRSGAND